MSRLKIDREKVGWDSVAKLSQGFKNQMFKPTKYDNKNLGRMSDSDMRKEYTRMSKIANKRIKAIEGRGYYSPSVANLRKAGITNFGLKNQGLTSNADIRKAYRGLMDFLNSTTSTRTGIMSTADAIVKNFGVTFNGNYAEFTQKTRKLFNLYEDLRVMEQKGEIKIGDKYETVADLGSLYDDGIIDADTSPTEVKAILEQMAIQRKQLNVTRQSQLNFHWNV